MADLAAAFAALPEKIKAWLSSQEVTDLIADINNDLGLTEEERASVIPRLILRLAAQDLDPRDFIGELASQLGLDHEKAKEAAERIYQDVLKPVEAPLREAGVDVGLLMRPISPMGPIRPISPIGPTGPIEPPVPPTNLPTPPAPIKPFPPDKPLMLHQEEKLTPNGLSEKPSFKYRPLLRELTNPAPISKAEVKIPGQIMRIVHYSDFLTPLNQFRPAPQPTVKPTVIPLPKSRWFV